MKLKNIYMSVLGQHTLYKLNWLPDQLKNIDFMARNIKMWHTLG